MKMNIYEEITNIILVQAITARHDKEQLRIYKGLG